jgi:Fe-S oxidoreductase
MKQQDPMKTVKALVGDAVLKSERCCGESGTLGVTRPDISTQVRFRKEEEIARARPRCAPGAVGAKDNVKILTSCPSCLQGLSRYGDDLRTACSRPTTSWSRWRADPGRDWMPTTWRANAGGIERVLV